MNAGTEKRAVRAAPLRAGDLRRRCDALRDACSERAMGKSHALHVAARMLLSVSELIAIAEETDGTDQAAEVRRLSDLYLAERATAERLREQLALWR